MCDKFASPVHASVLVLFDISDAVQKMLNSYCGFGLWWLLVAIGLPFRFVLRCLKLYHYCTSFAVLILGTTCAE